MPTQIVTAYFRHVYGVDHQDSVNGIIYRSAVREGGRCIVLFIENEECGDADEPEAALTLSRAF